MDKEKIMSAISDEDLNSVVGGMGIGMDAGEMAEINSSRIPFACRNPKCGEVFYIKAGASIAVCPKCKKKYEIKG